MATFSSSWRKSYKYTVTRSGLVVLQGQQFGLTAKMVVYLTHQIGAGVFSGFVFPLVLILLGDTNVKKVEPFMRGAEVAPFGNKYAVHTLHPRFFLVAPPRRGSYGHLRSSFLGADWTLDVSLFNCLSRLALVVSSARRSTFRALTPREVE